MNYGPKIVTSGLVLALDAADKKSYSGSGTTWNDLSENNNTITFSSAPTFVSSNGGYFNLTGAKYGTGTLSSSLKPTSITLEAWVNFDNSIVISDNRGFITVQNGNAAEMSYGLKYIDTRLGVYVKSSAFTGLAGSGNNPTLVINTWYHGMGTYDGTTLRMYVNGIQRASSTTVSGNIVYDPLNTKIVIGGQYLGTVLGGGYDSGFASAWDKLLGPIRVYNRALSASEILQNFNATRRRFGI